VQPKKKPAKSPRREDAIMVPTNDEERSQIDGWSSPRASKSSPTGRLFSIALRVLDALMKIELAD
jgi:hypothetical protein